MRRLIEVLVSRSERSAPVIALIVAAVMAASAGYARAAALLVDNQWRTERSGARLIVVGQARDCADGVRTARRALRRAGVSPPASIVFASLDSIVSVPEGAEIVLLNTWRRRGLAWYFRLHKVRRTPVTLYFAVGAKTPIFVGRSDDTDLTIAQHSRPGTVVSGALDDRQ
jgi:hypothetical protein